MGTLNLLAATDFSIHARHAADRAARLAHETSAGLALLHVVPGQSVQALREWLGTGHASETQLFEQARQQLQSQAALLEQSRRVPVRVMLRSGSVLDEVTHAAQEAGAGLLVLGARGESFLRRLVVGTTSERLLRRTRLPVLVVRQAVHEPYRRVLLALDFSPWSQQALALARRVAPHAHLVLMHVFQVPFEDKLRFAGVDQDTVEHYRRQARSAATQHLHDLARSAGLRQTQWSACVVEGDAAFCIVQQEQQHDCDLVVMGKHGQSVTQELLLGSVTKHVLAEGSVDVLVATVPEAA